MYLNFSESCCGLMRRTVKWQIQKPKLTLLWWMQGLWSSADSLGGALVGLGGRRKFLQEEHSAHLRRQVHWHWERVGGSMLLWKRRVCMETQETRDFLGLFVCLFFRQGSYHVIIHSFPSCFLANVIPLNPATICSPNICSLPIVS